MYLGVLIGVFAPGCIFSALVMERVVGDLKTVVDTDGDNESEFIALLDDKASANIPWDQLRSQLAAEPRYLSLSSDHQRKQAFTRWKAQFADKPASASEKQQYLQFVHSKYQPNTIYAIFRRRFGRNPEISGLALSEKGKESLFREYVDFIKKSDGEKQAYAKQNPVFDALL